MNDNEEWKKPEGIFIPQFGASVIEMMEKGYYIPPPSPEDVLIERVSRLERILNKALKLRHRR